MFGFVCQDDGENKASKRNHKTNLTNDGEQPSSSVEKHLCMAAGAMSCRAVCVPSKEEHQNLLRSTFSRFRLSFKAYDGADRGVLKTYPVVPDLMPKGQQRVKDEQERRYEVVARPHK